MLFGMETELAFAARPREGGSSPEVERLLGELFALARDRVPSLPEDHGVGMFLANGARFYLDRGDHPEVCTPECQSPAELVCWQLACERILAELATELEKLHPDALVSLYRCNVDYSGNRETWGCHESYQHGRSHAEMAPQLIPHLVSRLVYTGAGGFDNTREKLEFLLSPRVPHLVHEVGADTPERGIYNTRDEPLSGGGFNRLHVICGESLCSELGNYLKLGATALVVRLVDAGVCRGSELALDQPLRAMRAFARDPSGRARAKLVDGRRLRAIEIQAEYLAMVEAQLGAAFMPPWAAALCARWRRVLEQLESGPESLATTLDWAIKHALFGDRMQRARAGAGDLLRSFGVGAELCEIDTRFGELSDRSLFHSLDLAGLLTHRIPERGSVEDAMLEPPAGARAQARGRAIRELHAERGRYRCRWDAIHDRQEPRYLDLRDPFAPEACWREPATRRRSAQREPAEAGYLTRIDQGVRAYNAEDPAAAADALAAAIPEAAVAGDREAEASARFWASAAHHDGGRLGEAESLLAPTLARLDGLSEATRIRVWTRQALILIERPAPLAEIERALGSARQVCRYATRGMGRSRVDLLGARVLGARGRTPAAILAAERALAGADDDPVHFSLGSHLRWLVTFLLRAGSYRRALTHLDAWRERVRPASESSYLGASLAIAESTLALHLGQKTHALERAGCAVERSAGFRLHRCRLAACIALLEAAAASRELAQCEAVLEETRAWSEVEIGELRLDLLRAQALVQLASDPGRAPEALRAAQQQARALDERLECERHVRELDEAIDRLD